MWAGHFILPPVKVNLRAEQLWVLDTLCWNRLSTGMASSSARVPFITAYPCCLIYRKSSNVGWWKTAMGQGRLAPRVWDRLPSALLPRLLATPFMRPSGYESSICRLLRRKSCGLSAGFESQYDQESSLSYTSGDKRKGQFKGK